MISLTSLASRLNPKMVKLTSLTNSLKASKVEHRVAQLVREFLPDRARDMHNNGAMHTLAYNFYRRFFPLELGEIMDDAMESGSDDLDQIEVDYFNEIHIASMGVDPESIMFTVNRSSHLISYACVLCDLTEHRSLKINEAYAGTLQAMHGEDLEMNDKLGSVIGEFPETPFRLEEIRGALKGTRHERFTEVVEYVLGVPENKFLRKNQENSFDLGPDGPWTWENVLRLKAEWDQGHRLHTRVYNACATWDANLEKHMARVLDRLLEYRGNNEDNTEVLN